MKRNYSFCQHHKTDGQSRGDGLACSWFLILAAAIFWTLVSNVKGGAWGDNQWKQLSKLIFYFYIGVRVVNESDCL